MYLNYYVKERGGGVCVCGGGGGAEGGLKNNQLRYLPCGITATNEPENDNQSTYNTGGSTVSECWLRRLS